MDDEPHPVVYLVEVRMHPKASVTLLLLAVEVLRDHQLLSTQDRVCSSEREREWWRQAHNNYYNSLLAY